jgi:hypothetical protein
MLKLILILFVLSNLAIADDATPAPAPEPEVADPAPVIVPPVNPIAIAPMCVGDPRPNFTSMETFVKPKSVKIIVKYCVVDAYTGQYLREDTSVPREVNVEEFEKKNGEFKEVDWREYCQTGYISVFRMFEEGLI